MIAGCKLKVIKCSLSLTKLLRLECLFPVLLKDRDLLM